MIVLNNQQILNIKPTTNNVLIKINRNMDEILTLNSKLFIDPSFNPEHHVPNSGTIVALPNKISHLNDPFLWNVPCRPENIGDTAFFSYLDALNNFPNKMFNNKTFNPIFFDNIGNTFIWIKYHSLFCIKNPSNQIIPLNHFHICEPLPHEDLLLLKNFNIPTSIASKLSSKFAKVIAAPVAPVLYNNNNNLSPGDIAPPNSIIAFDKFANFDIQFDIHRNLSGKNHLVAIPQRDILAIIHQS